MIAELAAVDHSEPTGAAAAASPARSYEYPLVTSRWVDRRGRPLDEPVATLIGEAVPVSLCDRAGAEIARTITDINGEFRFDAVPDRDLALVFTVATASTVADSIGELPVRPPVLTWTGRPGELRLAGTIG